MKTYLDLCGKSGCCWFCLEEGVGEENKQCVRSLCMGEPALTAFFLSLRCSLIKDSKFSSWKVCRAQQGSPILLSLEQEA